MKKFLKMFIIAFAMTLIQNVSAYTMTYDELPNGSYVIGTHIFTRESGALTLRRIMFASRTLPGSYLDDMKVIYKTMIGTIVDASITDEEGNYIPMDISPTDSLIYTHKDLAEEKVDEVTEKANAFTEKYYNKFSAGDHITPDNENFDANLFYVYVGNYTGETPTEIKINNTVYDNSIKSISIGMSAYVEAPVWKIEDGKLYVATTWLVVESLPGTKTEIVVGDNTYLVNVFKESVAKTPLKLDGAYALNTVTGETNDVTVEGNVINVSSSHGRHQTGLVLSKNGVKLDNPNDVIYRLDQWGNMGITSPESVKHTEGGTESLMVTYSVYMAYVNGKYTADNVREGVRIFKLGIPGEGVVTVTINLNPIINE